jgi:hypothetical protein
MLELLDVTPSGRNNRVGIDSGPLLIRPKELAGFV